MTGIDNLDECIELLNQHDWDLMVSFYNFHLYIKKCCLSEIDAIITV